MLTTEQILPEQTLFPTMPPASGHQPPRNRAVQRQSVRRPSASRLPLPFPGFVLGIASMILAIKPKLHPPLHKQKSAIQRSLAEFGRSGDIDILGPMPVRPEYGADYTRRTGRMQVQTGSGLPDPALGPPSILALQRPQGVL
jgi:hypothetical protein